MRNSQERVQLDPCSPSPPPTPPLPPRSDLDNRKAIPQGRVIKDDIRRYPRRDNSLTGGFAGGELGLQTYVQAGDVPIAGGRAGGQAGGARRMGKRKAARAQERIDVCFQSCNSWDALS